MPGAGGDGPEPRHDQEYDGVDQDGVGQGEEPVGAGRVDQRGHGDDGVGGVEVAADQEPGDPGAELAPAEAPFVDMGKGGRLAPARGDEAEHGDEGEEEGEDSERRPVDIGGDHASSPPRLVLR